jgi:hypothetical protein
VDRKERIRWEGGERRGKGKNNRKEKRKIGKRN